MIFRHSVRARKFEEYRFIFLQKDRLRGFLCPILSREFSKIMPGSIPARGGIVINNRAGKRALPELDLQSTGACVSANQPAVVRVLLASQISESSLRLGLRKSAYGLFASWPACKIGYGIHNSWRAVMF